MGNDGGSIPTRRELVKSAARAPNMTELKATTLESLSHAWSHCFLTSAPLEKSSAVSDWRGRLYNYESVLRGLMPSADTSEPDAFESSFAATGLKSLRDISKLKFKLQPRSGSGEEMSVCPVSLKELGPATKSVYLVPCGHVFAEAALREVQEKTCPECGEQFADENTIPLLPTEEAEVKRLVRRMDKLRESGLSHTLKKDKTASKKKRKADEAGAVLGDEAADKKAKASSQGKTGKASVESRVAGINNPMAASLAAKVLTEQDQKTKRRKLEEAYKNGQVSKA